VWHPAQRWLNSTAPWWTPVGLVETLIFSVPHAVAHAETATDVKRRRTLTGRLMRAEIIGNKSVSRSASLGDETRPIPGAGQ
jgi:hypothetical protein